VDAGSGARNAGLRPGDVLLSVNGHPVRDLIDVQFFSAGDESRCVFEGGRGKKTVVRMNDGGFSGFGVRFEPMRFCACGNHCLFCFTDQNPRNLRPSLYFKDEDYRLSFLYGNYVTLTAVDDADLRRIASQRLSPLYVSVHAVDPDVRRRMLGLRKDDRLLDKLRFLSSRGIEVHGQVVLCPGWNDGPVLGETIETLAALHPAFRSLSVVPVGLTRHRGKLPRLDAVDAEAAGRVLRQIRPMQARFRESLGEPFVYCADELYLISGRPIPSAAHYGDFWQSDNGVGMVRSFLTRFGRAKRSFPRVLPRTGRFVAATGMLAGPVLRRHVMPVLKAIRGCSADVIDVPNRLFGESVTVSGLLTGADFRAALSPVKGEYILLLPSNCLNADGVFLDDWTPGRLAAALGREVRVLDGFERFWERP
jgi:putative radical SAM enzyme (TIGR03279 family)